MEQTDVLVIGGGQAGLSAAHHLRRTILIGLVFHNGYNLTTALLVSQAAARAMISGGRGGSVLNVSSVRGQLSTAAASLLVPGVVAYGLALTLVG